MGNTNFDTLWDYSQPAQTEAHFRALLPQFTEQNPLRLELLTQIARTQGLQRQFAAAHATLDEVEAALKQPPDRVTVRYWLERGRVFNSAGEPAQARPLFLAAWETATQLGEEYHAIDAAHMLGIIEPPEEQLGWNLKALEIARQATDPRARQWAGSLNNNIGWSYFDASDYTTALDYFQRALAAREEQKNERAIGIARWCIAKTLRVLGRVAEALAEQQALLAQYKAQGTEDGYVYEELGECYLALAQPEQAAPYFAQAYASLSQDPWLAANEAPRMERMQALSRTG
ncbi:MAG: hypothetical protein R3C14_44825 [Caldilineaceae bacterium]